MSRTVPFPRWWLSAKYGCFIFFGLVTALRGQPTLQLVTSGDYARLWALVVALFAAVGLVGSLRETWALSIEFWGALGLASLLIAFVASTFWVVIFAGDLVSDGSSRSSLAAALLVVLLLPAGRAWMIFRGNR